ncbi:hypothetical protein EPA93_23640 [Ktedonosporobacter rubrisoli]|uniref:Uncharacterized protein n=1 Tax=Ktedonosporobacter rubrisoli TaxID=2509675 RepID=A0A4P6JTN3_KTERU|nr:hypothetical protein [Ktedonosporobacter rubrisoli]QBD78814.1 hypothetical protein EPA93_23640 [Ktedonosporobacter rubrisoli]
MWPFDQNNQQMYQQYAQAYDSGNYYGLDHNQAWGYMQQFMQSAPEDMQQQIYQQHFAQMPYEQRTFLAQQVPPQYYMDPNNPWSMAQGFLRMGREQPSLLQRILSHPFLMGGILGLAGLVAKHMLTHHQNTMYGGQPQYGYDQNYPNQGYPNQGYPNQGYPNQGYQDQNLQQELNQVRREEQELRRELNEEERREEHHHHHRQDYY